jgi:hypothetical protein
VDFWDLTRLLFRRWYFSVPALVLTAVASVWALIGVSPNYIATAYVQLAPPISQPTVPGQQSLDQRNPWIALGTYNLANAAVLTVQQHGVVESLKANGYSESFTVTLKSSSPLVTFEVTGSSPQQATDTANELIRQFTANVRDLQVDTYGVADNDLVVARRIDFGSNIEESDARVKRAAVAVAGLGVLLTLGFTLGLDALLGRHARRRAGLPVGLSPVDLSPPAIPTATPPRRSNSQFDSPLSFGASPRSDADVELERRDAGQHQGGHTSAARPAAHLSRNGFSPVTPPVGPDTANETALGGPDEAPHEAAISEVDATVVLPLTHRPLRRREVDEEGIRPR